ncbi:MAG: hypothetical protein IV090_16575 [Candidatus Sericytochromatia bacterium]|nr:hypothetical protein [Candidatus Sericytochromatia bacterium]
MFKHFDALKELQSQSSQFKHKRSEESDRHFQQGIQLLQMAVAQKFSNPNTLGDAADAIALALKFNTQNPELYAVMGYLLILVEDFYQALRFLRAALKLAPDDQQAQSLLHYAQAQMMQMPKPGSVVQPEANNPVLFSNTQDLDYDDLYDQVEKVIQTQVLQLMQDALPYDKPTKDRAFYLKLEQTVMSLENQYQQITDNIQIVDQEIETSDLKNQLKPMESRLKQYKTCLQACEAFQELDTQINVLEKEVLELNQQLKTELSQFQLSAIDSALEAIMDTCDTLADRLDGLEKQGYSIASLEEIYAQVVSHIEKLNESYDDASAKNQH